MIIKVLIIVSLLDFIHMLPTLNKPAVEREYKASESKLYQNKDLTQEKGRKDNVY
jgi:hypothetical protein